MVVVLAGVGRGGELVAPVEASERFLWLASYFVTFLMESERERETADVR